MNVIISFSLHIITYNNLFSISAKSTLRKKIIRWKYTNLNKGQYKYITIEIKLRKWNWI